MPNGVAWSKAEITELVKAAEKGECLETLAEQLNRTPEAVVGKARKLSLKFVPKPRL